MLRPHRIAIGLYDRTSAGLVRRHRLETDIAGERTEVPELVGEPRPDLVLVNDDDLTYAKIRLDEHSLATLVSGIGEFADVAARGAVLGGRLGHVPGRRAGRARLRQPGAVRRRTPSPTSPCCRRCCAQAAAAVRAVRRPGLAQTPGWRRLATAPARPAG